MMFMGPLQRVTAQVGLEKGLGLKSTSTTSYSLQIPTLTQTLKCVHAL